MSRRGLVAATIGHALEWFDWNAIRGRRPSALPPRPAPLIAPTAMAELFPTQVRSVGLGMPCSLTVAVFGGRSPHLVERLTDSGHASWFPWHLAGLCLISLVVFLTARETKGINLDQC